MPATPRMYATTPAIATGVLTWPWRRHLRATATVANTMSAAANCRSCRRSAPCEGSNNIGFHRDSCVVTLDGSSPCGRRPAGNHQEESALAAACDDLPELHPRMLERRAGTSPRQQPAFEIGPTRRRRHATDKFQIRALEPVDHLGDGVRRFMRMAILILEPRPALVAAEASLPEVRIQP